MKLTYLNQKNIWLELTYLNHRRIYNWLGYGSSVIFQKSQVASCPSTIDGQIVYEPKLFPF